MKSSELLISVIIPIYNVEKWLQQCIDSIMHQTYKNLQIILIDDGSTDACGKMCDQFAEHDERISVIHKKNGGLSEARNCGLDAAKGAYICFVDSDDYLETDMLETLLHDMEQDAAEIAVCNYVHEYEIHPARIPHTEEYQIAERKLISGSEFIRLEQQKSGFCVVAWNKLYRKEIFDEVRFPVGKIHEDEFVFHRIVYPRNKIKCDPYVGYHYRIRNNSIMSRGGNARNRIEAFSERCCYFIEKGNQEFALVSEARLRAEAEIIKSDESYCETKKMLAGCFEIEKQLYHKGWISHSALMLRWLLFYPLRPAVGACRRTVRKMRQKSKTFDGVIRRIKKMKWDQS